MDISELGTVSRILMDNGEDAILICLKTVADFLKASSSSDILARVVSDQSRLTRIEELVSGLDHVGFVTLIRPTVDLHAAAEHAGFDRHHWTFPSTIVARELGVLVGVDEVATSIFKARGLSLAGAPIAVEVFMPDLVDVQPVKHWIEGGCAVHIGFAISASDHFDEIVDIMSAEGFYPPPFSSGLLLTNEIEQMIAMYFDGKVDSQPLRLEFCYFHESETVALRPSHVVSVDAL